MGNVEIYILNVGQADTSIIRTPEGNVIVIDAVKPRKIRTLLDRIIPDAKVTPDGKKILSPFWFETTTNAGYHNILNLLDSPESNSSFHFLSGYARIYPDGRDKLPDLVGASIFRKYDISKKSRKVILTCQTGTIRIVVDNPKSGRFKTTSYREEPVKPVPLGEDKPDVPRTDWDQYIRDRLG